MKYTINMPTSLPSVANLREHWRSRALRTRKLRGDVYVMLRANHWFMAVAEVVRETGATITLTRVSLRRLDDDNLAAALKPIRDGVADALAIDDGDARLRWRPEQNTGSPDFVRVSIDTREISAGA